MTNLSIVAKNAGKFLSDNSPSILTAVSVVGVVSTSVMAVKATPQAVIDIQHAESEFARPITPKEKVKLAWKYYIPALSLGTVTIGCILGANSVHSTRNAALVSVYSLTDKAFTEYQAKVRETLGEASDQKVRDHVAKDRMEKNPVVESSVVMTGNGTALCYDPMSGRYFETDIEKLRKSVNDLNYQINNDMYASLNDFYDLIGLGPTKLGDELGWTSERLLDVSYSAVLSEGGKPCISIDYRVSPVKSYYKGY